MSFKAKMLLIAGGIMTLCIAGGILIAWNLNQQYYKTMPKRFPEQWALHNTGQTVDGSKGKRGVDMNIVKAWKITKGAPSVIIGILDTGIQIDHPALKDQIYRNSNEVTDNKMDDDQNGYIDDTQGWNFLEKNNKVYDSYLHDYHGTSIAGIIAASHETGAVAGVAPNVKILPLKSMRSTSGSMNSAIEAIEYAHKMGVKIINCSWDSLNYNEKLEDTMKRYPDILFICSSGKTRSDLTKSPVYPACFELDNVISVAAITNTGELYEYSGYGENVDVAAPGEKVLITLPDGDVSFTDGTSIAVANVTGVAALIQSKFPELSALEIAQKLRTNARKIKSLEGKCASGGVIDAAACLSIETDLMREGTTTS